MIPIVFPHAYLAASRWLAGHSLFYDIRAVELSLTMIKEIVNNQYLLQKSAGKGGWTYATIPDVQANKRRHFGVIKTSGFIDSYKLEQCNLMPLKQGILFLPVKAAIRKAINKQAGDLVHIILYGEEEDEIDVRTEFLYCLEDEPDAFRFFKSISQAEQNAYVDWISAGQNDAIQVKRMAEAIDRLQQKILLKK